MSFAWQREMAKNTNLDKEMEEEMEGVEDSDGSEEDDSGRKQVQCNSTHILNMSKQFQKCMYPPNP